MKHTTFMKSVAECVSVHLPEPYRSTRKFGETRWLCQVYFGGERRIHYEVSRPWSKGGRCLELGLHFETTNRDLNAALLVGFDKYLFQMREALDGDIRAEQWDKGWTKVYETHPGEELSEAGVQLMAERMAQFIVTAQPILEHLQQKRDS